MYRKSRGWYKILRGSASYIAFCGTATTWQCIFKHSCVVGRILGHGQSSPLASAIEGNQGIFIGTRNILSFKKVHDLCNIKWYIEARERILKDSWNCAAYSGIIAKFAVILQLSDNAVPISKNAASVASVTLGADAAAGAWSSDAHASVLARGLKLAAVFRCRRMVTWFPSNSEWNGDYGSKQENKSDAEDDKSRRRQAAESASGARNIDLVILALGVITMMSRVGSGSLDARWRE